MVGERIVTLPKALIVSWHATPTKLCHHTNLPPIGPNKTMSPDTSKVANVERTLRSIFDWSSFVLASSAYYGVLKVEVGCGSKVGCLSLAYQYD